MATTAGWLQDKIAVRHLLAWTVAAKNTNSVVFYEPNHRWYDTTKANKVTVMLIKWEFNVKIILDNNHKQ